MIFRSDEFEFQRNVYLVHFILEIRRRDDGHSLKNEMIFVNETAEKIHISEVCKIDQGLFLQPTLVFGG